MSGSQTGDLLVGVLSAIVIVVGGIAIALAKIRERVARLEEWIRQRERKTDG